MEAASAEAKGVIVLGTSADQGIDGMPGPRPLLAHPVPVALLALTVGAVAFISQSGVADRLIAAFMALVLVVLAASDLKHRIIPNRIVLPATAVVLVARVAAAPAHTPEFVIATIGAGLAFLLPNLLNSSAMGMGDVKLAAFLGAGLGWGVIGAVAVAFISVFPFALGTLIRGGLAARKAALPFGPFLALGALVILIVPRLVGLGGS
jgi:leader peptidase (prepilin peptidase)/N-methyltransferase